MLWRQGTAIGLGCTEEAHRTVADLEWSAIQPLRPVTVYTHFSVGLFSSMPLCDSEAVLGVWLPAPLPTPRALPDHGAFWPLAVGVEKYLGGIDV